MTHSYPERQPRRLYRSRKGMIFGVCAGLADYLNLKVVWVRVIAVIILLFTGIWPIVVIYLVAALLMNPEPVLPLETEEAQEFYSSYTSSRSLALQRLKRTFDSLDRRVQRIETAVTNKEYDWERRLNEGS
jgi:phage shock protein C